MDTVNTYKLPKEEVSKKYGDIKPFNRKKTKQMYDPDLCNNNKNNEKKVKTEKLCVCLVEINSCV